MEIRIQVEHGSCFNDQRPDDPMAWCEESEPYNEENKCVWYKCPRCNTTIAVHIELQ